MNPINNSKKATEKVQIVHPLAHDLANHQENTLQKRFQQLKSTQGIGAALGFHMDVTHSQHPMRAACMSVQKNQLAHEVILGNDISIDFGDYMSLPQDIETDGSKMW